MFGTDPDQAEQQLSQWAQGFTDKAERFGAMRAQIEQIQVTESSTDGAVRVTIDASGAPIDLAFTDKIGGMPPSEVSAQVMACMRRAQRQLTGRVQEAMVATVGGADQVVENVVECYRQRFGEDQPGRPAPDPGVLGLGVIEDDPPRYPSPPPARRSRTAPGGDDENFGDRHYLR